MGNKDDLKFTWELDESKRPLDLIKSRGTWILVWNKAHKKYHMTGTEAQRLLDELGRVLHRETIEAHLPESFALEDDLTVEFAIKLAGQDKEMAHLRTALEKAAKAIMRLCEDPSGLGCPQLFGPGCPRADDPPQCPFGRAPTKEEVRACWMAVFGLKEAVSEKDALSVLLGELNRTSEDVREVMAVNAQLRAQRDELKKRVGELEFRETVAANTVLHLTTCFARLWRSVLNRQFDSRSLVGDVALDMRCEIEQYLKDAPDPAVERKLKEALND